MTVNEIRYKLPGYLYCKYFPSIILGFISYSRISGLSYMVELGSGWRHEETGKTIRQILRNIEILVERLRDVKFLVFILIQ